MTSMKDNKLMIITAASLLVTGLNAQESQERPPQVQAAGPDQVIEEIVTIEAENSCLDVDESTYENVELAPCE